MDLEQGFLDFCQYNRGLSENTIRSYRFDIREYLEWLKRKNLTIETAKLIDLDDYLIYLAKKENKRSSINQKIYCLRTFYRWAMRREIVRDNMTIHFQNLKSPRRLPRFLTTEQQQALLKAAKTTDKPPWMRERDCLLMLFFMDTGLRVEEVSQVKLEDVDLKEQTIRVIGKGDKERIMVISDRLKAAIQKYLRRIESFRPATMGDFAGFAARGLSLEDVGREIGVSHKMMQIAMRGAGGSRVAFKKIREFWKKEISKKPQSLLFFNRIGKPLITRYLFRIVKALGRKIGISDLHPHMLRHSFATNLRRKGADILLIKEALGHSSVNTTQIYAHIEDQEYRKALKKYLQ